MSMPAKLTAPRLGRQVVTRERVNRLVDDAACSGAVWIEAPAGFGKTVVAADWARTRRANLLWYELDDADVDAAGFLHYLREAATARTRRGCRLPHAFAPDVRQPVAPAVRAFVRTLYGCLPTRSALVVDNAEILSPECTGMEVLRALIAEARGAVTLLVLGRVPPPGALARSSVEDRLIHIGCAALRLTPDETREIALRRNPRLEERQLVRLHEESRGWPAAVRLLAARGSSGGPAPPAQPSSNEALFEYVAHEVFDRLAPEHQALLLSIAPLPVVSSAIVAATAGEAAAGMLENLARGEFLTYRLPGDEIRYRVHPLVRDFLLRSEKQRADEGTRARTRREAATALARRGEVEAAADLWIETQDWAELADLLESHGDVLLLQGRYRMLLAWIQAFPQQWLRERPLVALWHARAIASVDPPAAIAQMRAIWDAVEVDASLPRQVQAWHAVTVAHVAIGRLVDDWADAIERLLARLRNPAHSALRRSVLAMTYAAQARSAPREWDYAEQAAIEYVCNPAIAIDTRLSLASRLRGGPGFWRDGAQRLPEPVVLELRQVCLDGGAAVMPRLCWMWADSVVLLWTGTAADLETAARLLDAAAELAAEYGITHFSFPHTLRLLLALNRGDMVAASGHAATLRALPPPHAEARYELAHRNQWLAAHELACGRAAAALERARDAVRCAREAASPFVTMNALCVEARAAASAGDPPGARRTLREALKVARAGRIGAPRAAVWLVTALLALEERRAGAACAALGRGFGLMSAAGLTGCGSAVPLRADFARLCSAAWRAGIGREAVERVVVERGLVAPCEALAGDWPWAVRLHTFGGLHVNCAERAVDFGRKPPRKVLQLLRLLATYAPRLVPAAQAVDTLWPDLAGDDAHRAFLTALHRLRKLLGEKAVLHAEGRVGLNLAWVSIDRVDFERLASTGTEASLQGAIALYRGAFLQGDDDPFASTVREHVRMRFQRAAGELGAILAARGEHEKARNVIEAALLLEPAAEELYQGAISACRALGLHGEAVSLLRRAERAIGLAFGVDVSSQTRRLALDPANRLPIGDFARLGWHSSA